jgi:purine nucleosidase
MAIPLILDVDTGIDDALAIAYALASPEAELIACGTVMGNVTIDQATRNTLVVLEAAGASGVEVAEGAARPLVNDHEPFPVVHGEEGLGRAVLPVPSGEASDRSAAEMLVARARDLPGRVLLVATGPLTNVALALGLEPSLPDLLGGFAWMGGAYARGGNATPAAEANAWVDPDAAAAVFRAFAGRSADGLPIGVGLDVTERVKLTAAQLASIVAAAPGSRLATLLGDAVPSYLEFSDRHGSPGGASMHDPLAVAIAIDPGLATLVGTRVEIETDGTWTRGMTVADLEGIRHSPWPVGWETEENARVALEVEADTFMGRFLERITTLVREAAEG